MQPKSNYQRHIVELSAKLPAVTDKQKQWAFDHCFEPTGYYSQGSVWCLHCGEVFQKTTSELTIEIDLTTFKVIQSRGVCNHNADRHNEIIQLVNKNINLIKK